MAESRDGIRSVDRRAWGYSQILRYNGRDTLNPMELVGCTNLDHKQGLVPLLMVSRGNILEVDLRIVDSVILAARDFVHDRDEDDENFPLMVPHPLTAVIKMVFDSAGECTAFEILDVCTNSPGGSLNVNDVKEVKI